ARAALGIAALLLGAGLLVVAGTYAAGALLTLGYARRALARRADVPRPVWHHGATRRVVRQAGPLLVAGGVDTLLVSLAPIVLSRVDGAAAVGAHGAGMRLAPLPHFPAVAIAAAVPPVFPRSD